MTEEVTINPLITMNQLQFLLTSSRASSEISYFFRILAALVRVSDGSSEFRPRAHPASAIELKLVKNLDSSDLTENRTYIGDSIDRGTSKPNRISIIVGVKDGHGVRRDIY